MLDLENNLYYKRLSGLSFWPMVVVIVFSFIYATALILAFYFKYVPDLMVPLTEMISPKLLTFLESSINRITFKLGFWVLVAFVINFYFIYVLWNLKKLLADLKNRD
jgi:hypothetical protein